MASSRMLPVASARVPSASFMVAAFRPLSAASACVSCAVVAPTWKHIRGAIAKGNPQPHRQQDGKNEDPENRFRLAQE